VYDDFPRPPQEVQCGETAYSTQASPSARSSNPRQFSRPRTRASSRHHARSGTVDRVSLSNSRSGIASTKASKDVSSRVAQVQDHHFSPRSTAPSSFQELSPLRYESPMRAGEVPSLVGCDRLRLVLLVGVHLDALHLEIADVHEPTQAALDTMRASRRTWPSGGRDPTCRMSKRARERRRVVRRLRGYACS